MSETGNVKAVAFAITGQRRKILLVFIIVLVPMRRNRGFDPGDHPHIGQIWKTDGFAHVPQNLIQQQDHTSAILLGKIDRRMLVHSFPSHCPDTAQGMGIAM